MKKVLVVIDYQNDFITGSLGFKEAELISSNIVKRIDESLLEDYDLVFTYDTHGDEYVGSKEWEQFPIIHCKKGTIGWEVADEIKKYIPLATKIIEKDTFGSEELAIYLRDANYDIVEFIGVTTNICVYENAKRTKELMSKAKIIVNASCTATISKELHQKALDELEQMQIEIKY